MNRDYYYCRASRKPHMIGIARIILVVVNNELSVNGLEINFFDTERSIGNVLNSSSRWFFFCFKLGKWLSFLFYPCTLMLETFLRTRQVCLLMLDLVVFVHM